MVYFLITAGFLFYNIQLSEAKSFHVSTCKILRLRYAPLRMTVGGRYVTLRMKSGQV